MAVDLHLHSNVSDGTDPPQTIVQLAATAGLSTLALTDHDTLAGIGAARLAAAEHAIRLIPGTELSVNWPTGTMHMLVYYLEPGPGPLQDRLAALVAARDHRNREIIEQLKNHGVHLALDDVLAEAGGGVVGRPHIAAVMVASGYVADMDEAFDVWLGSGRPGYVPRARLGALEAIELARASDAVPVVAHPHTLGVAAEDYRSAFTKLAAGGLGGIESYYAEYDPPLRRHLAEICETLGIVATGGSDYHGRYKPGLEVGVGRGDLRVPDEVVDRLDQERTAGRT